MSKCYYWNYNTSKFLNQVLFLFVTTDTKITSNQSEAHIGRLCSSYTRPVHPVCTKNLLMAILTFMHLNPQTVPSSFVCFFLFRLSSVFPLNGHNYWLLTSFLHHGTHIERENYFYASHFQLYRTLFRKPTNVSNMFWGSHVLSIYSFALNRILCRMSFCFLTFFLLLVIIFFSFSVCQHLSLPILW